MSSIRCLYLFSEKLKIIVKIALQFTLLMIYYDCKKEEVAIMAIRARTFCVNKGTSAEFWILLCVDRNGDEWVSHAAPNKWKTEKGAIRWAKNHGYEI